MIWIGWWFGAGDEHCVVPYNHYWWTASPSGVKLSDGVDKMIEGHSCTGMYGRSVLSNELHNPLIHE